MLYKELKCRLNEKLTFFEKTKKVRNMKVIDCTPFYTLSFPFWKKSPISQNYGCSALPEKQNN